METKEDKVCWKIVDSIHDNLYNYSKKNRYDWYKDQPKNIACGSIDIEFRSFRTDINFGFDYADEEEMSKEFTDLINHVLTPEILNHYRKGLIKNLSITIGPDTISGSNINDEDAVDTYTYA